MKIKTAFCSLIAAASLSTFAPAAEAAVVISVSETAGDTTFLIEGSIDTDATTLIAPSTSFDTLGFFSPNRQVTSLTDLVPINIFSVASAPGPFGPNLALPTNATSRSGDEFAVTDIDFVLAQSYVSGSSLSSSLFFQGATINSLGLISGSYVWTLAGSGDTITLEVPAAVPLPPAVALILAGLGALTVIGVRKPRGRDA
ncbi:MAG: hypothetical protein AAGA78_06820 [Pseudomonadota bacterium]